MRILQLRRRWQLFACRQYLLPYTHREVLYWNFMRFNPTARYRTGLDLHAAPGTMMRPGVRREGNHDLLPARLPKGVPGLAYLGRPELDQIFAANAAGQSSRAGFTLIPPEWIPNRVRTASAGYGTVIVETRQVNQPGEVVRTLHQASGRIYFVGAN